MDPIANPYTPNAGAIPQALIGRDDQVASFELLLGRLRRRRSEQSMIVTGLRGVGKTVLLGRFREMATGQNWVVVELEVAKHDDGQFRRDLAAKLRAALFELSPRAKWNDRLQHAAAVLRAFTVSVDSTGTWTAGIDVEAAEGLADHGDLGLDLTDVLVSLGEAAQDIDRGVVLLFDEIQFLSTTQLESVIQALHKVVQRSLPLTLVGAGLPQIAELAGDAKSYAERLFKFPGIGDLPADQARQAFALPAQDEGATFEQDALETAVAITSGYPYFIQELGYAVWGLAQGPSITKGEVEAAVEIYEAKLDSSFFRVRLDRATELERAYLRAMAELGDAPQKAADVAGVLGRTSPEIAPVRAKLIGMGLLYTPEHGYAAFTVPHFDQFMKRVMPTLEVPPKRSRAQRRKRRG